MLSRRDLLKGATGAGLAAALAGASPARRDLIREENARPGTPDWQLTRSRVDPKMKFRCPWIEGYCSHTSLRAGETLEVGVHPGPDGWPPSRLRTGDR